MKAKWVLLGIALGLAGLARAEESALVTYVRDPVTFSTDGVAFKPLQLGQSLAEGARIRTGQTGNVFLKFSDGSELRLGINTELSVRRLATEGGARHTFLSLLNGFARALVNKLSQGSSFEVGTPIAIAAVKGTDFETDFEDGHATLKVFEAAADSGVLLTDLNHQNELLIKENQAGGFGPGGFDPVHPLTDDDKHQAQQTWGPGKPPSGGNDGNGNNNNPVIQGNSGGDTPPDNLGSQVGGFLNDALNDLGNKLNVDHQKNNSDRLADATTGKTFVDRFGYLVQTSSYVVLPTANTVAQVFVTQRAAGPQAGQTYLENKLSYYYNFPNGDWMSVVNTPINAPANLDINLNPINWKIEQDVISKDAFGSVAINTSYSTTSQPSLLNNYAQDYLRSFVVNNVGVAVDGKDLNGVPTTSEQVSTVVTKTSDQGWSFAYVDNYLVNGSPVSVPILTETVYLVDSLGNVANPDSFLGQPSVVDDLKAVNQPLNFEIEFTAPGLNGHVINNVLTPDSFQGLF